MHPNEILQQLPLKGIWHQATDPTTDPTIDPTHSYLMIVLHGRGDSPEGYDFFPTALNVPGLNYLMLQAPDVWDGGGYSWYGAKPDQLPGILNSRKLLEESLTVLIRSGWKTSQIFLLGFSQGCLLTLEFGSRFKHALAGYIGISGYVYDANKILEEIAPGPRNAAFAGNWLVTHGTEDDLLPIGYMRKQIELFNQNDFPIEWHEYPKTHTIDEQEEMTMIRHWVIARMKKS